MSLLDDYKLAMSGIAEDLGIELPNDYYRYAPCECWKCKRVTLVFTWPDRGSLFPIEEPLVLGRPRVVQFITTRMSGSAYWGNVCGYCGAVQGNFFLYMEPDGCFFGLRLGAFEDDLTQLAGWWCNGMGEWY